MRYPLDEIVDLIIHLFGALGEIAGGNSHG